MTKISELELTIMERRFRKSERDAAVRNHRRTKAKTIGGAAKSVKIGPEPSSLAKKLDDASAALLAAGGPSGETADTPQARAGFVLWRVDLKDSSLPFKTAALVMEIGATLGSKVMLHHLDPDMVAAGTPSVPVSIAKLGTESFTVYRDLASASLAAERENTAVEQYKRTKKA
jgi:hypothetical protein